MIGKAHRMGLSNRPSPIKKTGAAAKVVPQKSAAKKKEPAKAAPQKTKAASKKTAAPVVVSGVKNNPLSRTELAEPHKIEKEEVPPGGGVALIDLTERMCRWPIGDPREDDFTFCGRGIRPGTPYCPDHAGMAYQSSSRMRAAAAAEEKEAKDVQVDDDVVEDDDADEVVEVS